MKKSSEKPASPGASHRVINTARKERQALSRPRSEADLWRLQQELDVHRIELEMQNKELRAARVEMETGLELSAALFDFAPVGYFNLTADGSIRRVNLAGAGLMGRARDRLVGTHFALFVAETHRRTFNDFLARTFARSP